MNAKINISREAAESFADEAGLDDIDRAVELMQLCVGLCQIEAVSPEKDQRIQDLEARLWDVNAALVRAGVYPAAYPTFGKAIEELARKKSSELLSEAEIKTISKAGAEMVLDIITGWRREPIPFSKDVIAYQISIHFRDIIRAAEASRITPKEIQDE